MKKLLAFLIPNFLSSFSYYAYCQSPLVKMWDHVYGGWNTEIFNSIIQTEDKGFLLGGSSTSDATGDKTQSNRGVVGSTGDMWIVKLDSLGLKQWDKRFGGSENDCIYSLAATSDHGYILGGTSNSNSGGDKSENNWDVTGFTYDYWIVKIDSAGNKLWDKDFGGVSFEVLQYVTPTKDKGFLLSGSSESNMSGNKSENNLGFRQTWIVKMDSIGGLQWEKTIQIPGLNDIQNAIESSDGCIVMGNLIFGSSIGGYQSEPHRGHEDFWIIKFCDSTLLLQSNATTVNQMLCPGTCIDFINLSMYAASYQWNFPGASPDTSTATNPSGICYASPGSYDVQLIATSGNRSDTLFLNNYITVNPFPQPQGIMQTGDTLFANPGVASYQWYYNGNSIAGATHYFYIATQSGNYNVVATDVNGCEVEAVINNVIASTLSPDSSLDVDCGVLTVFPNPVQDKFTMQNAECIIGTAVEISIFNVLGEKVIGIRPLSTGKEPLNEIDVFHLPSGIYSLEIISCNKIFQTKFLKQ